VKKTVIWVVTLYSGRYFQTFGGISYGGSGFLQNIGKL